MLLLFWLFKQMYLEDTYGNYWLLSHMEHTLANDSIKTFTHTQNQHN